MANKQYRFSTGRRHTSAKQENAKNNSTKINSAKSSQPSEEPFMFVPAEKAGQEPNDCRPSLLTARVCTILHDGQHQPFGGISGTEGPIQVIGDDFPPKVYEWVIIYRPAHSAIFTEAWKAIRPAEGFAPGTRTAYYCGEDGIPGPALADMGAEETASGGSFGALDHAYAMDFYREVLASLLVGWNAVDGKGHPLPAARPWIKKLSDTMLMTLTLRALSPVWTGEYPPQI